MKIRLMPMAMAIRVANVRREYLGMSIDVSFDVKLHHVPSEWFEEDCFLDVEDIDYYGHFLVRDNENGEEYSIPAWMVSDIVKDKQEV